MPPDNTQLENAKWKISEGRRLFWAEVEWQIFGPFGPLRHWRGDTRLVEAAKRIHAAARHQELASAQRWEREES